MKVDYIIRGGRVMDPATQTDAIQDIAVLNNRIAAVDDTLTCEHIIDASGCVVSAGFIDYHTHVFYEGSTIAIKPDMMLAQGTTTAVDAGTAGVSNYEAFYRTAIVPSIVRVKGYITTYGGGQLDPKLCEDFDPALVNEAKLERLVDKYRDHIEGLKIRLSQGVVPDDKAEAYLQNLINLADRLNQKLGTNLKVCVHTTHSAITAEKIASILRSGDIFCHCFQGRDNNILQNELISPGILQARQRGVIFDAANGKGNFGNAVAQKALSLGFLPDIISSDLTSDKFNLPPYAKNLPVVLSKYLSFGMGLMDVLKTVTINPAKVMGLSGEIGSLQPGHIADIVVFKTKAADFTHKDWNDSVVHGDVIIVPQMTICAGEIQFCQSDFYL